MDGSHTERSVVTPLDPTEIESRARAALEEGRTVPHERVRPWLEAITRGERPPRPRTDAEIEAEARRKR